MQSFPPKKCLIKPLFKNSTQTIFKGVPHEWPRSSIIWLISGPLLCTGTLRGEKQIENLFTYLVSFGKAGQFTLEKTLLFNPKYTMPYSNPMKTLHLNNFPRVHDHPDPQYYDCSGDPLLSNCVLNIFFIFSFRFL